MEMVRFEKTVDVEIELWNEIPPWQWWSYIVRINGLTFYEGNAFKTRDEALEDAKRWVEGR